MIDPSSPWIGERPPPSPFQVALRIAVLASAAAVVGFTRAAAASPLLVLELVIVGLAALCAVMPDSHVGLLVVLLVGVNWVVAVDDATTAWAIGAAASIGLFHLSMSAASVSPAAAAWTPAVRRRWGRRSLTPISAVLPMWLLVNAVVRVEIGGSSVVLAGALAAIAVGGLWAVQTLVRGEDRGV